VKEDYSFYLDFDPLYIGVIQSEHHLTRVDKHRIVGRPARYSLGVLMEPEVPCMWGDMTRRAPTLVETSGLPWRDQGHARSKIYCVRLPVLVDDVNDIDDDDFSITGRVASSIIWEHMHVLQELSVGPLSCTDEVRCMITDVCYTGADCPAMSVTWYETHPKMMPDVR